MSEQEIATTTACAVRGWLPPPGAPPERPGERRAGRRAGEKKRQVGSHAVAQKTFFFSCMRYTRAPDLLVMQASDYP
jgi:hypothetical protein